MHNSLSAQKPHCAKHVFCSSWSRNRRNTIETRNLRNRQNPSNPGTPKPSKPQPLSEPSEPIETRNLRNLQNHGNFPNLGYAISGTWNLSEPIETWNHFWNPGTCQILWHPHKKNWIQEIWFCTIFFFILEDLRTVHFTYSNSFNKKKAF